MSQQKEMTEGKQALDNFKNALGKVLRVSHADLKAQLEAEKKEKLKGKNRE